MSGQNGAAPGSITLARLLEDPARIEALKKVMPKHLTPERLAKVALNAWHKTPLLQRCSVASLWQALTSAAELGLDPGGALGHAYLVPFKDTCQLIIGYRGFIELARRSGSLAQIEAHVVHEHDTYEVEFGSAPKLRHVPKLDGDPGKPVFVYMVARLRDGSAHVEVMTIHEVEKIRARSRSGNNGPWQTDFEEMAKKTVVRRGMKYLPLSPELSKAMEIDNEDFVDGEVLSSQESSAGESERPALTAGNEKAKAVLKARTSKMPIIDMSTPEEPQKVEQTPPPAPPPAPQTEADVPY